MPYDLAGDYMEYPTVHCALMYWERSWNYLSGHRSCFMGKAAWELQWPPNLLGQSFKATRPPTEAGVGRNEYTRLIRSHPNACCLVSLSWNSGIFYLPRTQLPSKSWVVTTRPEVLREGEAKAAWPCLHRGWANSLGQQMFSRRFQFRDS